MARVRKFSCATFEVEVPMRNGDQQSFYPKSERIYRDSYGFWVKLREGLLGPYITEGIARANLSCFLESIRGELSEPALAKVAL
jgi:hypothetical protein